MYCGAISAWRKTSDDCLFGKFSLPQPNLVRRVFFFFSFSRLKHLKLHHLIYNPSQPRLLKRRNVCISLNKRRLTPSCSVQST